MTALFADVVGSSAIAEQLGPEVARLVVADAVARIAHAVELYGGYVKDVAGDGVLALFGAPAAHEDDPERALLAALRIVEDVGAYAIEVERAWGLPTGVRVGVETGEVVAGIVAAGERVEYGATGDAVNVAARLQSSAEPGQILAGTALYARARALFAWGEPLTLTLKGRGAPVEARPVLASTAQRGQARALPGMTAALVGREREIERLRGLVDDVWQGTGSILFVTGEAGIGKSRLRLELHRLFEAHPAPASAAEPLVGRWLEGRCASYAEAVPYSVFADLLREWLGVGLATPPLRTRVALRATLDRLFGDRATTLRPYLGALLGLEGDPADAGALQRLSPEALQYRSFEVVEEVIERLAGDGPIVVCLEDLHWADVTSLQLAERLLALSDRAPVLFVLTARPERDQPGWRLREVAAREYAHRFHEVALEGLSPDTERLLLDALVGAATLPDAVERDVLDAAGGNPFFLEELVRSMADSGAITGADGRPGPPWRFTGTARHELPPTIEAVIRARLDRLEPGDRAVLGAASVLGRRFTLALLESVVDDQALVPAALARLQRLDLVRESRRWPEPEYRFKHALIQETAHAALVRERRIALHRRAAEALEGAGPGTTTGADALGLLAHHWLAAADEERAMTYLGLAGDRARAEWALDEAIERYRELLPILERRGLRQEAAVVLLKLGLALHTALRFAEANDAFQRAFGAWTPPSPHPGPDAVLRLADDRLPAQFDPPRSYSLPDMRVQMALFDRLVERWPEATIVPSLAESWAVSDDGLRYTFRLREGVRWSDGVPLTARDVEFGIKRGLDPARPGVSASIYFVLEGAQDRLRGRAATAADVGVRALDERTVEFRLAAPAPYFLSVVNRPDGGPVPRHAIERYGDAWLSPDRQVVSGGFRQVTVQSDRLVLERRPESGRPGNVGRVELSIAGGTAAADAYARGELDVVVVPPLNDLGPLDAVALADRVIGPPSSLVYVVFDLRGDSAPDLPFRRALSRSFDRAALVDRLPANLWPATGGLVPPALQGHTPDAAPTFDPDAARAELRESRCRKVRITAWEGSEPLLAGTVERWREILGDVVEVTFEPRVRVRGAPDYPFLGAEVGLMGWFPGYPDPEYFLRLLLHSEATDNAGGWSHAPYDDLIERARRERDGRRRLDLFHAADRLAVADQVPIIPLAYTSNVFYVKPHVRGWWEFGKSWSGFGDLTVG